MPQVWSELPLFWPEMALTIGLLLVVLIDASGVRARDGLNRLVTLATLAAAFASSSRPRRRCGPSSRACWWSTHWRSRS